MRQLSSPAAQTAAPTPISKGGTGGTSQAGATSTLEMVATASIGTANGSVALDASGLISPFYFPSTNGVNIVSLDGDFTVAINTKSIFTITDYNAFRVYTVRVTAGTVVQNADSIIYTAPATATASVTLTINARAITFAVVAPLPDAPSITTPLDNYTNARSSFYIGATPFVPLGDTSTHLNSDWQVATDAGFTAVVKSSLADATNKTGWTVTGLAVNTLYYLRVRYRGSNNAVSAWSEVVVVRTRSSFAPVVEEAKLKKDGSPDLYDSRYFTAISDDGLRVVMCLYNDTDQGFQGSGSAHIFRKEAGTWIYESKLTCPNLDKWSRFGVSGAIDANGTRAVIGSREDNGGAGATNTKKGKAYVFLRTGTAWTLEATLTGSLTTGNSTFGENVQCTSSCDRVLISAALDIVNGVSNAGAAYIFSRTGTAWTQEARIIPQTAYFEMYYGIVSSITYDGSRVAVGAINDFQNSINCGSVHIYVRTGTAWALEQRITPANPQGLQGFGCGLKLAGDGTRILIGSGHETVNGLEWAGAAYIYSRSGSVWSLEATLKEPTPGLWSMFGWTLSTGLTASRICIGAYNEAGLTPGTAYIYTRSGTTWTLEKTINTSDGVNGDKFPRYLCMVSGEDRFAGTALLAADGVNPGVGAVYIFS